MTARDRSPWHRDALPRWAWAGLLLLKFVGVVLAMVPLASAVLLLWWWTHAPDPTLALLARRGFTGAVLRSPAPELGPRLERWRIVTTRGDTLRGLFRAAVRAAPAAPAAPAGPASHAAPAGAALPAAAAGRPWAVVMLGGIGTGDRAALLLPDSLALDVLAMDWPWRGPRRMSWLEFMRQSPAVHEALHQAPATFAHGAAALRRVRAPTRVAVLGASLGSPAAIAALRLTPADALVVVDGMADLESLFEAELERALPHAWLDVVLAPPLAVFATRLVHALEPARHAAAAAPVPALLIDAAAEERYPRESVRALHAVLPHAQRRTHPGGHLVPEDPSQVRAIVTAVDGWLRTVPDTARVPSQPPPEDSRPR